MTAPKVRVICCSPAHRRKIDIPLLATLSVQGDTFVLEFESSVFAVTVGQSAVLYDGTVYWVGA
jgi:tRNA U34 2-thiouridine synthase MnmA/TrmU